MMDMERDMIKTDENCQVCGKPIVYPPLTMPDECSGVHTTEDQDDATAERLGHKPDSNDDD